LTSILGSDWDRPKTNGYPKVVSLREDLWTKRAPSARQEGRSISLSRPLSVHDREGAIVGGLPRTPPRELATVPGSLLQGNDSGAQH
jgi:hypothetical protein